MKTGTRKHSKPLRRKSRQILELLSGVRAVVLTMFTNTLPAILKEASLPTTVRRTGEQMVLLPPATRRNQRPCSPKSPVVDPAPRKPETRPKRDGLALGWERIRRAQQSSTCARLWASASAQTLPQKGEPPAARQLSCYDVGPPFLRSVVRTPSGLSCPVWHSVVSLWPVKLRAARSKKNNSLMLN